MHVHSSVYLSVGDRGVVIPSCSAPVPPWEVEVRRAPTHRILRNPGSVGSSWAVESTHCGWHPHSLPQSPQPLPQSRAATSPSSVLGEILTPRARASHRFLGRVCWDAGPTVGPRAESGSLPDGSRPEAPVWFEFPAPLAPCTNPQPSSELPGLRLIWALSPPRQHFMALKGRPRGQSGAVATAGSRASPAVPPAPGLASPFLQLWRKPARQPAPHRGGDGGESWNRLPLPSQAASLTLVFI